MLKKETTYAKVIHWLSFILFAGLFVTGLFITALNTSVYDEKVRIYFNNPLVVVVSLLGFIAVCFLLNLIYDKCLYKCKKGLIVAAMAILSYILATVWIVSAQATPQSDALILYDIANQIDTGFLEPLNQSSYIVFFPYQLGFVSFLRLMIKIFGYGNYIGIQLVLALNVPLIIVSAAGIIHYIVPKAQEGKATFFMGIFSLCSIPLYMYSTFIYGDLPYAGLSMVSIWLAYECLNKKSWISYLLLAIVSGLNCLIRTNAYIVVIAIVIYLLVKLINKENRKKAITTLVSLMAGIILLGQANKLLYKDFVPSGYSSLPLLASVVMGMNDDYGNAGWCNFYHQIVFTENNFDPELTKIQCRKDMIATLKYWVTHPASTADFFYRKINYQWNAPLYQALVMNSTHNPDLQNGLGRAVYYDEAVHMGMQRFMKAIQLSFYGLIAATLWFQRKKIKNLDLYLPLILIFGSFVFSLMWEAKTRYQMPTLAFMLPLVAAAVTKLLYNVNGKDKIMEG